VSPQEQSQINTESDVWSYRQGTLLGEDISTAGVVGYKVEALDGSIGKVDDATYDEGSSRLIVDTGGWILGKKVMLPAGVVRQIKNAPEFEERHRDDDAYLSGIGAYYGPGGMGYQDWEPR
jgi:hypothetical protein